MLRLELSQTLIRVVLSSLIVLGLGSVVSPSALADANGEMYCTGLTIDERSKIQMMWAEASQLEKLRTGIKDKNGNTYEQGLSKLVDKYVPRNADNKYSDRYKEYALMFVRSQILQQKLFEQLGPDSAEYKELVYLIRTIRIGSLDVRRAVASMEKIGDRVMASYNATRAQIQKRIKLQPNPTLAAAYLQKTIDRDETMALVTTVRGDMLNTMKMTMSNMMDSVNMMRETTYWVAGAFIAARFAFMFGDTLGAASEAVAASSLRQGAIIAGSTAASAPIAGVGGSAIYVVSARVNNIVEAYYKAHENGTTFACELRRAQALHPVDTWNIMLQGFIHSAMIGPMVTLGMTSTAAGATYVSATYLGTSSMVSAKVIGGIVPSAVVLAGVLGGTSSATNFMKASDVSARVKEVRTDIAVRKILVNRAEKDLMTQYYNFATLEKVSEAYRVLSDSKRQLAEREALATHLNQEAMEYAQAGATEAVTTALNSAILAGAPHEIPHLLKATGQAVQKMVAAIARNGSDNAAVAVDMLTK